MRLCLGPCSSRPREGWLGPHVCPALWLHPQSTRVLECLSCVILKVQRHPQCLLEDARVLPAHKPTCARPSCPPLYLTLALRPVQELGARLESNREGLTSCHRLFLPENSTSTQNEGGRDSTQKVLESSGRSSCPSRQVPGPRPSSHMWDGVRGTWP